jgi:hypothetical protein
MLRPRLSVGFFIQGAFVAAWGTAESLLRSGFLVFGPTTSSFCLDFVLVHCFSSVSFLLLHLSPLFAPVWCSLAPLRQSCEFWFKLKLVPVDLHLFGVLLFDSRLQEISAAFCCALPPVHHGGV